VNLNLSTRIFFVAAVLLTACARPGPGATIDLTQRPIRVTATVGMIGDLVENIGGARVIVTGLMGPGVDPHLYKPSIGDVSRLNDADLIVYGGLHLEGRMAELFEQMAVSGRRTVAVSDGVPPDKLRPADDDLNAFDPHIWFDVSLWQYAATHVRDALITLDPGSEATYRENTERYLVELRSLDAYAMAQMASIPQDARVLITAHDAFGYFGARYGLEVKGIQGASTASEASASNVRALADDITNRKVKAIFVESAVSPATINAVQEAVRARGWQVAVGGSLFADALGAAGTPEGTYLGMVKHNVDTIVGALK
jgi:manganese/zinc/iron transport system substrate-binding protein